MGFYQQSKAFGYSVECPENIKLRKTKELIDKLGINSRDLVGICKVTEKTAIRWIKGDKSISKFYINKILLNSDTDVNFVIKKEFPELYN